MRFVAGLMFFFCTGTNVHAQLRTETVEYRDGDTVLEGYLVFDGKSAAKKPGVMIVHDWLGINAQVKKTAERLAALGYTVFAADIYGKGLRPEAKDAGAIAGRFKEDRNLLRRRAQAGLQVLAKHKTVNAGKLAATGYCFGGTTVLELARSGADIKGAVSFHGGLDTPTPQDAKNVKAKILILHGADDPHVPPEQVTAFENEMRNGKVDWELVKYSGAVHAFTIPAAGNDNSKGAAYNAQADRRSWEAMRDFLKEIL